MSAGHKGRKILHWHVPYTRFIL